MTTIAVPFKIKENGKIGEITDQKKAAEQRIIDVLVTTKGERVMRPAYGGNAMELLFEPVDDLLYGEFRVDALNELSRFTSGVNIEDLIVSPADSFSSDDYETTLNIGVRYSVGPFDRQTFSFYLGDPNILTQESTL